jgi:hypothetical protein
MLNIFLNIGLPFEIKERDRERERDREKIKLVGSVRHYI